MRRMLVGSCCDRLYSSRRGRRGRRLQLLLVTVLLPSGRTLLLRLPHPRSLRLRLLGLAAGGLGGCRRRSLLPVPARLASALRGRHVLLPGRLRVVSAVLSGWCSSARIILCRRPRRKLGAGGCSIGGLGKGRLGDYWLRRGGLQLRLRLRLRLRLLVLVQQLLLAVGVVLVRILLAVLLSVGDVSSQVISHRHCHIGGRLWGGGCGSRPGCGGRLLCLHGRIAP